MGSLSRNELFKSAHCKQYCFHTIKPLHPSHELSVEDAQWYRSLQCDCPLCWDKQLWFICLACWKVVTKTSYISFVKRHNEGIRHKQRVRSSAVPPGALPTAAPNPVNDRVHAPAVGNSSASIAHHPVDEFPGIDCPDEDNRPPPVDDSGSSEEISIDTLDELRRILRKRKFPESVTETILDQPETMPRDATGTLDSCTDGNPYYYVVDAGVSSFGRRSKLEVGSGPQALVGAALTDVHICEFSALALPEDTRYHLLTAKCFSNLSASSRADLHGLRALEEGGGRLKREGMPATCVGASEIGSSSSGITDHAKPATGSSTRPVMGESSVITTAKELKRKILSGRYSIVKQVPRPKVLKCGKHAYIPYSSVIKHVMACGLPIAYYATTASTSQQMPTYNSRGHSITSILDSRRLREVVERIQLKRASSLDTDDDSDLDQAYTCVIPFSLWQDSFDPSGVKRNKGSIWMKTMTLLPPPGAKDDVVRTFPIALAAKSDSRDLDLLEQKLASDLESITQSGLSVWDHQTNRFIKVTLAHVFNLQDRPERSSSLATLGHGGLSSKRFGYLCRLDEASLAFLPSCAACRKIRQQRLTGVDYDVDSGLAAVDTACSDCCDWSFESEQASNLLSVPAPAKYPKRAVACAWATPPPGRELTTDPLPPGSFVLLPPVKITFEFLKAAARYTYKNVYTKTWGVGQAKAYASHAGLNDERASFIISLALRRQRDKNPEHPSDEELFIPAWLSEQVDVKNHVETPMHLLFLGVVKSFLEIFDTALSKIDTRARVACMSSLHDALCSLKDLSIEWAKAWPFSSAANKQYTRGLWVSENYMGYARIVKYSMSFAPVPCQADEHASSVYSAAIATACSLYGMLHRLMTRSVSERKIKEATLWIKEFLSSLNELEIQLVKEGEAFEPLWSSRSNFLGLLNLPNVMDMYGPIREMWEGGTRGEGFIGEVKQHITNGIRPGADWITGLLKKVVKRQSLKYVLGKVDAFAEPNEEEEDITTEVEDGGSDGEIGRPFSGWVSGRYRGMYISADKGTTMVDKDKKLKPISAFVTGDGTLLVPYYEGKEKRDGMRVVSTLTVEFDDEHDRAGWRCGCWFCPLELVEQQSDGAPTNRKEIYDQAKGFVLLLPRVFDGKELYYAIDDSWRERDDGGTFVGPRLIQDNAGWEAGS